MKWLCICLLGLLSCTPGILGTWRSGSERLQFNRNHIFRAWDTDSAVTEKWYVIKSYDHRRNIYVERYGPGKDTLFPDLIYFKYEKNILMPAFEYHMLGLDTLLINAVGESIGGIYLKEKRL